MLTSAQRRVLLALTGFAAAAALTGCASSNAVPRPFPSPDWHPPAASVPVVPVAPNAPGALGAPGALLAPDAPFATFPPLFHAEGRDLAEYALGFRGVPYRFGGADPDEGFDCSGLVQYVFAQYGVPVPRVVEQQYLVGEKINDEQIQPGDLLFFATKGPGATHVAIAIGENRFVHAPNARGVVRVEALTSEYWSSHYMGARRIPGVGSSN